MYNTSMKKYIFVMMIACLAAGCAAGPKSVRVGADRDAHGCIGSAGYTWSEELGACIRPWEYKDLAQPETSSRTN